MPSTDLYRDLDPQLAEVLDKTASGLRQEFDDKLNRLRAEIAGSPSAIGQAGSEGPPAAEASILDPLEELKQAVVAIDGSSSQAEILRSVLAGAVRFCSRSAIFLMRGEDIQAWGSQGFPEPAESAGSQTRGNAALWSRLHGNEGVIALSSDDCRAISDELGGDAPQMGLLLPFVLGDEVAAGVYCDRVEGDRSLNISALQLLAFTASQVLENLPVRQRRSTSTLTLAADSSALAEEPDRGAPQASSLTDTDPSSTLVAPAAAWTMPEPEVETPEPTEPVGATDAGAATPAPPPEIEPAVPSVEVEPSAPVVPEEFETPSLEPAAGAESMLGDEVGSHQESDLQTSAFATEPAAPIEAPPPPAVDETPAAAPSSGGPEAGGSTQVRPPEDVQGPGWAFSNARAEPEAGEDARHEEARRLARLLVTEIKLYNEEVVEEGRTSGNIYNLLREDIDRSRQIFEDRIDNEVRASNDYFQEALVRILAGGDASILGL